MPREPVVHEVVQIGIRRADFDAAPPFPDVLVILPLGRNKAVRAAFVRIQEITAADAGDFLLVLRGAEHKPVGLLLPGREIEPVLHHGDRGFVPRVSFGQFLFQNHRRHDDTAFALEGLLIHFPGDGRPIRKQEGFIPEVFDFIVILILLIGRDGGADDGLQILPVFPRLVHPGHITDGKVRINAQLAPPTRQVVYFETP
ncbi:hypothetical protein D1872_232230 [compost metagenome]